MLLKGPIGPMVAALTVLALVIWDRRAALAALPWLGLGADRLLSAIVLPWALAITVATDGGFWGVAVGGDLAPKLFGGQEGHGAPPGYFLLLSPVLLFPAALLLPAAAGGRLARPGRTGRSASPSAGWSPAGWCSSSCRPSCRTTRCPLRRDRLADGGGADRADGRRACAGSARR